MDHQDWRGKIARLIGDATGMAYEKRRELNVLLEQIALKHENQPAKPIPTICLRNVEPWPIVDISGPVHWDSEGRLHIGVQVKKPNAQFNDDADMVVQVKKWYANQQPPLPKAEYEKLAEAVKEKEARIAELERWNKTQVGIITERDAQIKRDEKTIDDLQEQIEQLRTERNVMHNKLHDISNIVTSEK